MARKTKKTAVSTKDLHRMIAELQAALDTERLDHCATRSLAAIQLKACEVLQKLLIKALDLLDTHCASLLLKGEIMIDALLREVELDAKELEKGGFEQEAHHRQQRQEKHGSESRRWERSH